MPTTHRDPEAFPVEDVADLLIVVLYAPGKGGQLMEPVMGITRLQKLIFLLQQGLGPGALVADAQSLLSYKPYKMGPFSKRLLEVLEDLKAAGIIVTERLEYWIRDDSDEAADQEDLAEGAPERIESFSFSLSQGIGKRAGEGLWLGLSQDQQTDMRKFKSFFNTLSLRQLLIYTYERFPEFTGKSTIKKDLGLAN